MEQGPSAEEAAAIAAAIERFEADLAGPAGAGAALGPWHRAALAEGVAVRVAVEEAQGGEKWLL